MISEASVLQEQEGFTLFMLCHYFGRRGRAMARSLAWQEKCPVPLELVVFYQRDEDAALVGEGASDGPAPPILRTIRVSESQILRRALLFSEAQTLHRRKFTVFCDADLWFPSNFWSDYLQSLLKESPGYWSCRVRNIPVDPAEVEVSRWQSIDRKRLDSLSHGIRYDQYSGQVGHFQCIPRDLARYPAIRRSGVEASDMTFAKLAIERSENQKSERRIGVVGAYHFDHPWVWYGTGGREL